MNLTQAEAIASLYSELLSSVDRTKIPLPSYSQMQDDWATDDISEVYLEDGQITVKWSRYIGCGEYDSAETNHSLDQLFD